MSRFCVLACLALALVLPARSQDRPVEEAEERGGQTRTDQERRYDELVARFQRDYLRLTALIQIAPTVPFEDTEGQEARFDVAAAWLGLGGRLGENVGYFVRGAFEREPSLLEAYVSYGSDDVRGIVGRQMVPFSYEFLVGAANIDFVNRSRIVREVGPGRRTGVALHATPGGGPLRLRAGVFNASYTDVSFSNPPGQAPEGQAERGGVLVAGRAQGTFPVGTDGSEAIVGFNVAYDTPDTSDRFAVPGRLLLGGDARLHVGRVLVAGEYLLSDPGEIVAGVDVANTHGGYATLGYDVSPDDRVLARLDVLSTFSGGVTSGEVLLGYNRTLTRAASVQVNVILPLDSRAEPTQALANFQLAF